MRPGLLNMLESCIDKDLKLQDLNAVVGAVADYQIAKRLAEAEEGRGRISFNRDYIKNEAYAYACSVLQRHNIYADIDEMV